MNTKRSPIKQETVGYFVKDETSFAGDESNLYPVAVNFAIGLSPLMRTSSFALED
jgi:hypothetical protein